MLPKRKKSASLFALRNTSISMRLTASLLIMCIFPMLVVSALFYVNYQRSVYDTLSDSTRQGLVLYATILDFHMRKCESVSDGIMMDRIVQAALSSRDTGALKVDEQLSEAAKIAFNSLFMWESYMKGFTIYATNHAPVASSGFIHLAQSEADRLLENLFQDAAYQHWVFTDDENGNPCVALCRKIFSSSEIGKLLGYVFIYVDAEQMADTINTGATQSADNLLKVIVDTGNDRIVLWNGRNEKARIQERIPGYPFLSGAEAPYVIGKMDGVESVFVSQPQAKTGWMIYGVLPKSELDIAFSRTISPMTWVVLGMLLLGVFVSVTIRRSIHRPMERISAFSAQVSGGDFSRRLRDPYPDEMGELSRNIDQMVSQIAELFHQNQENERKRHQMELEVLQYQINPHFLFNTLNSFQYVAELHGITSIARGVTCLCAILQHTLDASGQPSLAQEIAIVDSYVNLQHIKFAGMLSASYEIAPETENARVIRFLLQPIVENSIIHGMTESPLHLDVKTELREGRLLITVTDDGKGFDFSAVKIKRNKFNGIGLSNVQERLNIEFAGDYRFVMNSELGRGTTTLIDLPYCAAAEKGEPEC